MLILLLMVGGCGVPSSAATPVVASRTVVDAEGTTVHVPETVTRLVTLSEPTLDGALALGVVPVGTVSGRGQNSVPNYLSDKAAGVAVLGTIAQPNYEAIGAVRPDLMLVDGTSINNNPPVIEALRRIAPVVVTGYAGGDWRLNFTHVADALNLADQGAEVMADYDAAVAGARGLLTGFSDSTFSIVRWQGGSASVILKELPPGQALSDLGLRRPPARTPSDAVTPSRSRWRTSTDWTPTTSSSERSEAPVSGIPEREGQPIWTVRAPRWPMPPPCLG